MKKKYSEEVLCRKEKLVPCAEWPLQEQEESGHEASVHLFYTLFLTFALKLLSVFPGRDGQLFMVGTSHPVVQPARHALISHLSDRLSLHLHKGWHTHVKMGLLAQAGRRRSQESGLEQSLPCTSGSAAFAHHEFALESVRLRFVGLCYRGAGALMQSSKQFPTRKVQ